MPKVARNFVEQLRLLSANTLDMPEWFIATAIVVGLVIGMTVVWRPSTGVLWYCTVELLVVLGIATAFVLDNLRVPGSGLAMLSSIIPCWFFLAYSTGAAFFVGVPGYLIKCLLSRRRP